MNSNTIIELINIFNIFIICYTIGMFTSCIQKLTVYKVKDNV